MLTLVLLPGMDGTGTLFADFIESLPESIHAVPVEYPRDRFLTYAQLEEFVQAACPTAEPFLLLAPPRSPPASPHRR